MRLAQELARIGAARDNVSSDGSSAVDMSEWAEVAGLSGPEQLLQRIREGETALKRLEAANMGLIRKSASKMRAAVCGTSCDFVSP